MLDAILWVLTHIVQGFADLYWALANPSAWLDWSDKAAVGRVVYFGGSKEFFFAVLDIFLVITAIGVVSRGFLWGVVRVIEGLANIIGRIFAWAGLLMVVQQVMIVFLQRIFLVSEISLGPFGYAFTKDLSWWSEELKLYNAMIVAMCVSWTFVQGGHVRVDLFYAGMRFRAKKVVDMFGSLFFILPTMTLIWMFGWYFMWRHLVTPKINATESYEMVARKASLLRWNVETIGFSPNGFDAYFLFKVLLVTFAGLMFLQGWGYFYRSLLEFREGEESENKYLDRDDPGGEAEMAAHSH